MTEIRDRYGSVVARSRGDRCLRRKVGRDPVELVGICRMGDGEGKLMVLFQNKDSCECNWCDWSILVGAIRRWRNLYGAPLLIDGEDAGKISFDNPKLA